jgi:5-(hydroxymethyl)furfural/furfural oxidase
MAQVTNARDVDVLVDGVEAVRRLVGTDALRIVDASIMPTIPRANTDLSTIALAERVAELMLRD